MPAISKRGRSNPEDAKGGSHLSKPIHVAFWFLLLGALIVAAYGGSTQNGFVWDDETLIVDNASVADLPAWPTYFSDPYTISKDHVLSKMYRPVQTLSFALDWWLWNGSPGGFHITSMVLHLFVCLALGFAFGPVVGDRAAVAAATVFAIHPAISESVLGLASRGNQLYTLFGLLTVGCFLRTRAPLDRMHLCALVAFSSSLLAKEPAIALVVLVPLSCWLGRDRSATATRARRALTWAPFAIIAAIYLGIRHAVVGGAANMPYWGGSLWATVQMQAKVFAAYLGLIVWPFDLQARYVVGRPAPFPDVTVLLSAALCAGLLCSAAFLMRHTGRRRLAGGAVLWFFASLAPMSNLIPLPGSMMAERFLYFTLAGFLPLVIGAILPMQFRSFHAVTVAAALLIAFSFIRVDRSRTAVWRDNATFFGKLAEQLPDDPVVQIRQAEEELLRHEFAAAVDRLGRLSEAEIDSPFARDRAKLPYWYGRALLASGLAADAVSQFELAERHFASRETTLYLAESLALSGQLGRAREKLQVHLRESPDDDKAWNGLGNVLWLAGDREAARVSYRKAVALNPENLEAGTNLSRLGE